MNTSLLAKEQEIRLKAVTQGAPESSLGRRAQILLLYHQGLDTQQIAQEVGMSARQVRYWRQAFGREGMAVFRRFHEHLQYEASLDEMDQSERVEKVEEMELDLPTRDEPQVTQEETPEALSLANLEDSYTHDQKRSETIAAMAGELFDQTRSVHGLDEQKRLLLVTAARLHNLKSKPKAASTAVLAQPLQDFDAQEQALVAALVRWQREEKLERIWQNTDQNEENRSVFTALLTLLRLALGMDNSNSNETRLEKIEFHPDGAHIRLSGPNILVDSIAAQSVAPLWAQAFGQRLHIYGDAHIDIEQARQLAGTLSGPGIHPDDPMPEAGRKILRYHFLQMLVHEPGTRLGEDIEALHDMRVATRRMRAAFDVFGDYFQKKAIKAHRIGLRDAGRALGKVRDLDVFLEKAAHYLDSLTEAQRSGLDSLLFAWRDDREHDRRLMLQHLDSPAYQSFINRFNKFLNTPGEGALLFDEAHPRPQRVSEVAPMMIYTRLAAVRAYHTLLANASYEQLHALRIDFKYLRYTVEFFREVLGPEGKAVIDDIKTLQDHLGDLNDADVACNILQGFLENWEERHLYLPLNERHSSEPVVQYLANRHAERHRLLVSFPEVWAYFIRDEFRRNLALAVSVL